MKRYIALFLSAIALVFLLSAGTVVIRSNPVTATEVAQDPAMPNDLRSLSTRFERPESLQGWQEFQVQGWVPKWEPPRVENGRLVLQPKSSGWFEDNTAGHLYREITGDFIVTTRIKVEGTQTPVPQRSFSLAGLFVREPRMLK